MLDAIAPKSHGYTPPGYAPCTREPGQDGRTAHAPAESTAPTLAAYVEAWSKAAPEEMEKTYRPGYEMHRVFYRCGSGALPGTCIAFDGMPHGNVFSQAVLVEHARACLEEAGFEWQFKSAPTRDHPLSVVAWAWKHDDVVRSGDVVVSEATGVTLAEAVCALRVRTLEATSPTGARGNTARTTQL